MSDPLPSESLQSFEVLTDMQMERWRGGVDRTKPCDAGQEETVHSLDTSVYVLPHRPNYFHNKRLRPVIEKCFLQP